MTADAKQAVPREHPIQKIPMITASISAWVCSNYVSYSLKRLRGFGVFVLDTALFAQLFVEAYQMTQRNWRPTHELLTP